LTSSSSKFLVLWLVGLLLKLISSFLLIISFSSERCREFYNIFPKICIPSLNLWRYKE
jgi:hypothetical protein